MANNFAEAQKIMLKTPGAPTNWHLLTISFDPAFDTPAVLEKYAEAHGADPARWTFASGALPDVTAIGEQLSLTFWKEQEGLITHNLRTAVIDASGRLQKIFIGNEWQPQDLVAELVKAAGMHARLRRRDGCLRRKAVFRLKKKPAQSARAPKPGGRSYALCRAVASWSAAVSAALAATLLKFRTSTEPLPSVTITRRTFMRDLKIRCLS